MEFLLTEEQELTRCMVRDFAEKQVKPGAAERDEQEIFPREIFKQIGHLGLAGIPWPEEYGGGDSGYVSTIVAIEELARVDASVGLVLLTHILLVGQPLYHYGTAEQKKRFLEPLARGEKLGAFALSEPAAGSDMGNLETAAVREGNDYILNGRKIFTINAGEAEAYLVFAVTGAEKKQPGEISALIVEKGAPGFSFGQRDQKMGLRSLPTAALVFENCRVPGENRLGREGDGLKIATYALTGGRAGVAAQALGIARGALEAARDYARQRVQFGRPVINFQALSFMLADMSTRVEAARLLAYQAAFQLDRGRPAAVQAAMAKLYASETAMEVATNAVQVFGGYGYTRDYPVERLMREAKMTQIYMETSEMQRELIAAQLVRDS